MEGTKHRKTIARYNICIWLIQNNFLEGFQILCYNCNAKQFNHGCGLKERKDIVLGIQILQRVLNSWITLPIKYQSHHAGVVQEWEIQDQISSALKKTILKDTVLE